MRLAFLCVLLGVVATTNPEELPASVVNSFDCEEGLQTKTISDAAREVSKEKARKVIERAISGWAIRRRQKRKVSAIIDEPSNRSKEIVEPSDPTVAFSNLCERAILRRLAPSAIGLGVLTVVASETWAPSLEYCRSSFFLWKVRQAAVRGAVVGLRLGLLTIGASAAAHMVVEVIVNPDAYPKFVVDLANRIFLSQTGSAALDFLLPIYQYTIGNCFPAS